VVWMRRAVPEIGWRPDGSLRVAVSVSQWRKVRPGILRRDGNVCQIQGPRCTIARPRSTTSCRGVSSTSRSGSHPSYCGRRAGPATASAARTSGAARGDWPPGVTRAPTAPRVVNQFSAARSCQSWTCSPKRLNEDLRLEESPLRGQWVWGWRRGDDTRWPCFLTEREALSYMADRLRRSAAFE
jgi:hypothetical protein